MIYRVYDDKRHEVVKDGDIPSSGMYRCVQADADGWIPWHGGECPLPDKHPVELRFRTGDTSRSRVSGPWSWSHDGNALPIIAYRPILDADTKPEPPAWDGEGLPPVGCKCECWHTGTHQGVVTVRYMGSDMCVLLNHGHGEEQCGPIDAYSFRPIRSEEDRAVEDMERVFRGAESANLRGLMRALYRAGYRKTGGE